MVVRFNHVQRGESLTQNSHSVNTRGVSSYCHHGVLQGEHFFYLPCPHPHSWWNKLVPELRTPPILWLILDIPSLSFFSCATGHFRCPLETVYCRSYLLRDICCQFSQLGICIQCVVYNVRLLINTVRLLLNTVRHAYLLSASSPELCIEKSYRAEDYFRKSVIVWSQ